MKKHHTLSVLVQDEAGVLTRISSMFSRRGFNIESLAVGKSEQPNLSRMTISVLANDREIDQLQKQLNKIIGVLDILLLDTVPFVDREMILIQVEAKPENRVEISQLIELFRGRIVDVASESIIVEITGDKGKLQAIVELLYKFNIMSICRTGSIALPRGQKN